jgi:hypothetical protein
VPNQVSTRGRTNRVLESRRGGAKRRLSENLDICLHRPT